MKSKTHRLTFFLLFFGQMIWCQKQQLFLTSSDTINQNLISKRTIDTLYNSKQELEISYKKLSETFQKIGYIHLRIENDSIVNNSIYRTITFGKLFKTTVIRTKPTDQLTSTLLNNNKWILPTENIPDHINKINLLLDAKGYNFSETQLIDLTTTNDTLHAYVDIKLNSKRNISNFIIKGYDKFPSNYLKNINRKYGNKIFSQERLSKLQTDIATIPFSSSYKNPEVLFAKDATTIYLYLKKKKANRFDGFLGLSSNESDKTKLNGYIDLLLVNPFNKGEQLSLYWKDNGEAQKTFKSKVELPFIFNSPVGLKGYLEIFREVDQFQNTKLITDIGYHINFNSNLFIGYETNQSTTLTKTNTSLQDYSNNFLTGSYTLNSANNFRKNNNKLGLDLIIGIGERKTKTITPQQKVTLRINKNFKLYGKHTFYIVNENFALRSSNLLTNELFRFGGINSIRGFNENTLQGNQVHNLITEYRFYFSGNSYIHTITDYGFAKDTIQQKSTNFKSFGLGLGIASGSGLMQFIYANGSTDDNRINISNSIVHVGYKSSF